MPFKDFENWDKETIYRTLAIVASVTFILWGCLVILWPFIPAFLLAVIFALSAWPAFTWIRHRLGGGRTMAATLTTILLALCFFVPLVFLGSSIADNFDKLYTRVFQPMVTARDGHLPSWIGDIPWLGPDIENIWSKYVASNVENDLTLKDYYGPKLIATGAALGRGIMDVGLGVLIAFFFFRHGHIVSQRVENILEKFTGPRGQRLFRISKKTIIAVVYGLLGTALVQGMVAGIGFWIAGVPGAPFLGLLTMLVAITPIGPPLIWVPAAFWLFTEGQEGMGLFMAIWGLIAISGIDNVVRPYFISRGANLPWLLVLLGVLGGAMAFGFIGIFIGPTLLAVAYALMLEWSHTDRDPGLEPLPAQKDLS